MAFIFKKKIFMLQSNESVYCVLVAVSMVTWETTMNNLPPAVALGKGCWLLRLSSDPVLLIYLRILFTSTFNVKNIKV